MVSGILNGLAGRAEQTRAVAAVLFPGEEWVPIEPRIWAAASRLSEKRREKSKWDKEMSQARLLTGRGSVAYFLPEGKQASDQRCADIVLDGVITEMKTVTGNRETLGARFKDGYKQGRALAQGRPGITAHSVFIRLLSDLSVGSVRAKIAGELKERLDPGSFFCFFEATGTLFEWTYEELRAIIGT